MCRGAGTQRLLRVSIFLLLMAVQPVFSQTPTYLAVGPEASPRIAELRSQVVSRRQGAVEQFWKYVQVTGTPLIETIPGDPRNSLVTFLWRGNGETRNVVIFDGVAGFDAKDRMSQLGDTNVWFKSYKVRNDARFAYNLSPNDTLQSFDEIKGNEPMQARLAMFQIDPLNPHRCPTTFGPHTAESSFVELADAPALVWNKPSPEAARGKVESMEIQSGILKARKKLWIYTPRDFSESGAPYPLLILFDGDRNVMWIPRILDNLIAQKRTPPMVAIMIDDSNPTDRNTELPCNPVFAEFLAKEIVPLAREKYHTGEAARTIVAGSSYGGLAAVFAALRYPGVFGQVLSLSGSFWWKPQGEKESEWLVKQVLASPQLSVRFYLEVGLMEGYPMQIEANRHMRDVLRGKGYDIGYAEYDGGHAFLNWSGGMANGLLFFAGGSTKHNSQ